MSDNSRLTFSADVKYVNGKIDKWENMELKIGEQTIYPLNSPTVPSSSPAAPLGDGAAPLGDGAAPLGDGAAPLGDGAAPLGDGAASSKLSPEALKKQQEDEEEEEDRRDNEELAKLPPPNGVPTCAGKSVTQDQVNELKNKNCSEVDFAQLKDLSGKTNIGNPINAGCDDATKETLSILKNALLSKKASCQNESRENVSMNNLYSTQPPEAKASDASSTALVVGPPDLDSNYRQLSREEKQELGQLQTKQLRDNAVKNQDAIKNQAAIKDNSKQAKGEIGEIDGGSKRRKSKRRSHKKNKRRNTKRRQYR